MNIVNCSDGTLMFCPELDGLPSDVTFLSNDGGEFHLHKVLLNGYSKFFRAIAYDSVESLPLDRTSKELQAFFSVLYASDRPSLLLEWSNVFSVMATAIQYDVAWVADVCSLFLLKRIPNENIRVGFSVNWRDTIAFLKQYPTFSGSDEVKEALKSNIILRVLGEQDADRANYYLNGVLSTLF